MLAKKLQSATAAKQYVDDVFSTYLYAGNGSTQTINNGIDLAGKGGLVWFKWRSGQWSTQNNYLFDSARGSSNYLSSNTTTQSQPTSSGYPIFTSSGFQLTKFNDIEINSNYGTPVNYVSWTFRKAPKFFDVVTYTGDGTSNRQIPHSLGIAPGMVIIKQTNAVNNWYVRHFDGATGRQLYLDLTSASTSDWGAIFSSNSITLTSSDELINGDGNTYVAYLFAHDTDTDGLIQCGSYTGNGSATGPTINLGWEPQYLLLRRATVSTGNWQTIDNMRGMPVGSADATLQANLNNGESSVDYVSPTATGFQVTSTSSEVNTSGATYIYLAIRRPNKPPKTGTEVFAPAIMTGNGAADRAVLCGFVPDAFMSSRRTSATSHGVANRLAGKGGLWTSSTYAENLYDGSAPFQFSGWDIQDGVKLANGFGAGFDTNSNTLPYSQCFFRRAPGFFDVVCYTGTGSFGLQVLHNLGVKPELMIAKNRNNGGHWSVMALGKTGAAAGNFVLNGVDSTIDAFDYSSTYTPTYFQPDYFNSGGGSMNTSGGTYVAYLFATLPGTSKVGSYTGNGSSQTIDCGFATGARFILIKRTDDNGDWYVWDSARGIVSTNDPHLSLNTTAAEVTTDDSVDPDNSGFIVNQVAATNINVNSAIYIYLAIS